MRRTILLFALLLTFLLPGCGNEQAAAGHSYDPASNAIPDFSGELSELLNTDAGVKYSRETLTFGYEPYLFAGYDGTVYTVYYEGDGVSVQTIYPEAKEVYKLLYDEGSSSIRAIDVNADGIWLLKNTSILQISFDGEALRTVELDPYRSGLDTFDPYYTDMAIDASGYVYAAFSERDEATRKSKTTLAILPPEGSVSYAVLDTPFHGFVKTSDGQALIYGDALMSIDAAEGSIAVYAEIPEFGAMDGSRYVADGIYGGIAALCDSSGIYSLDSAGNVSEILVWSEFQLMEDIAACVIPLEDGKLFCYGTYGSYVLTPEAGVPGKETLTLAIFGYSNYSPCVLAFNETSSRYYIHTVDYCADGRSLTDAITLLNTQLMTGNGPDLICFDTRFSPDSYASKGLLCDIYECMDKDGELSRDDILFASLLESGGGLYALPANFYIATWYSYAANLDGRTAWSYEEFEEMARSLKDGCAMTPLTDGNDFLENCLPGYLYATVDWDAGSCSFDSEEFIEMLEFSKAATKDLAAMSESERMDMYEDGKFMMNFLMLSSPKKIAEGANLVGWPTPDGSCGSMVVFSERFGISSKCGSPEGAWEFIKYVMSADWTLGVEMLSFTAPVLKSALDDEIAELLHQEEPQITQAQADQFYEMIDHVILAAMNEPVIKSIITEEAQAFFAGDKTATETAKLIQNRVSLYMAEQS